MAEGARGINPIADRRLYVAHLDDELVFVLTFTQAGVQRAPFAVAAVDAPREIIASGTFDP